MHIEIGFLISYQTSNLKSIKMANVKIHGIGTIYFNVIDVLTDQKYSQSYADGKSIHQNLIFHSCGLTCLPVAATKRPDILNKIFPTKTSWKTFEWEKFIRKCGKNTKCVQILLRVWHAAGVG